MFEDLARNLVIPHQLGMTTVLVVPDGTKAVVREDWELEGRDAAHVDQVSDDLTGVLERLSATSYTQFVVPAKRGAANSSRHAQRERGIQYSAVSDVRF